MYYLIFSLFLSINVTNHTFNHSLYEVKPNFPLDISFEKPHGFLYLFFWSKCNATVRFYNQSFESEAVFTHLLNEDTASVESGQYLMKVHIESTHYVKVKFIPIIIPDDVGTIIVKTSRNTSNFTTTHSTKVVSLEKSVSAEKNYLFLYYDNHSVTFSSDSILVCSNECEEVSSSYTTRKPEVVIIKPNYVLEITAFESTNSTSPLERVFDISDDAYFAARSSSSLVYRYQRGDRTTDFDPIFNVEKKYRITSKDGEHLTDSIVALNNGTLEWDFQEEHGMLYLYTWTGNLTITLTNPTTGETVVNSYKTGNGFTAFESGSYLMKAKLNISTTEDKLKYIRFIGYANKAYTSKRIKLQTNSDSVNVMDKNFLFITYQDYVARSSYFDAVGWFYYMPNITHFIAKNLIIPFYASSPTYSDLSTSSLYIIINSMFPINGTINVSTDFTTSKGASFVGINGITTIPFDTTPTTTASSSSVIPTETTSSSSVIPTEITSSSSVIPTTTTSSSSVIPTETTSSSSVIPTTTTSSSSVIPTETTSSSLIPTTTTSSSSVIPTTTKTTTASSSVIPTKTTTSDLTVTETTLQPSGSGDDSDAKDEISKYKKTNQILVIALASVSVAFVILLIVFVICIIRKKSNQIELSDYSTKNQINTPLVY